MVVVEIGDKFLSEFCRHLHISLSFVVICYFELNVH